MKFFRLISTMVSKRSARAPEDQAPVEPTEPVAFTPRPSPRSARQEPPRKRKGSPPPFMKAQSGAAKPSAPPAAKPSQAPAAGSAPAPVVKAAPAVRAAEMRPPVPPVGDHGETDLAPRPSAPEDVTFPSVEASGDDVDRAAVRELFSEIAAGQAAPVKSFIGDLSAGGANGEWLQVCRPVMAGLLDSASSLGLDDAVSPMNEFIAALDLAAERQEVNEGPIDGGARDLLLESYAVLAKALPEVFAVDGLVSRRDTMLLHALLKQLQGVGIVTFDALYGAGLTSVEMLSQASPGELSATTGIPNPLCEAICAGLREHRMEAERTAHLSAERRFPERLMELLRLLVREHLAFERVNEEAGFNDVRAERKRAARRNRDLAFLKIEATLIEMGAVECADALRVLSFDRRIEHMEKFLGVRVAKRAAEHR